jgi:hypothetical protein
VARIEVERRVLENLDSAERERTQLAYTVVASVHADGSDRTVIEVVLRFLEKSRKTMGYAAKRNGEHPFSTRDQSERAPAQNLSWICVEMLSRTA